MKKQFWLAVAALFPSYAFADSPPPESAPPPTPPPAAEPKVKVTGMRITGRIEGENITFTVRFDAEAKESGQEIALVTGDLVLDEVAEPKEGYAIRYDVPKRTYTMSWPRAGTYGVAASFAARPAVVDPLDAVRPSSGPANPGQGRAAPGKNSPWRESIFAVPEALVRQLEIESDRTDLEVLFPGAMRVERETKDGKLFVKALMGPGRPFSVRWKPQVAELDAKLVLASEANTVVVAGTGALRLDTLFIFDIPQGKLRELAFAVPDALSVTQVSGAFIRDWQIYKDETPRRLHVVLNRPQTRQYALQVQTEMALPAFPADVDVPVLAPKEGVRASGHLAVGTDSAIHLVVKQAGALSQVDVADFPRVALDREHPRALPKSNAFYYSFASTPYQLKVALEDIVPSFDASERLVLQVREDDLVLLGEVELDVRDAPIRRLAVEVPGDFMVAAVAGQEVADHAVRELPADEKRPGKRQEIEVHFRQPVMGRTLVQFRLELGRGPLGQAQRLPGLAVRGAKNERGYLVVAADEGVQLDAPAPEGLRDMHTGAVPFRVPNAQYAYRYREPGWALALTPRKKPSGVRVESFHLVSLGDGIVYGSVAANYFITGAPVDELRFHIPKGLQNVEFVGRDVQRRTQDGERWTVKLQRKVIGDYNLGIFYTQRYKEGEVLTIGGVASEDVETQTGYLVVASHLHLKLGMADGVGATTGRDPRKSGPETPPTPDGLVKIERDEVPANYRLLVNAPILLAYKQVGLPHPLALQVDTYERVPLLPVVVEITNLETILAVREGGETESLTRARYKIKNATGQFLPLTLPADATVWSTHLIEQAPDRSETRVRVTSSFDKTQGLLVPLERRRNPNDPVTVELEYGQVHRGAGGMGSLTLAAPRSPVRSTFASWTVRAPQGWAVLPEEAALLPEERAVRQGNLSLVMGHVLESWGWALKAWPAFPPASQSGGMTGDDTRIPDSAGPRVFLAAIALGVLLIVFFARRPAFPAAALAFALAFLVWVGAGATRAPQFVSNLKTPDDLSTVAYTQALCPTGEPLSATVAIVPAWRQYATFFGGFVAPLAGAILLILAARLRRRGRAPQTSGPAASAEASAFAKASADTSAPKEVPPTAGRGRKAPPTALVALGTAGLVWGAACYPVPALVLGHLLTWGAPLAAVLIFLWKVVSGIRGRTRPAAAATAAVLLLGAFLLALTGCGIARTGPRPGETGVLERVACDLRAEKDSLEIRFHLTLDAAKPVRVPLLDHTAVLLSAEKPGEHLRVEKEGARYVLVVEREGRYEVALTFLSPLPEAGDDQARRFRLPLPHALRNRVQLEIPAVGLDVEAPTAVRFTKEETDGKTVARAVVGPDDDLLFAWRPRARQAKLEKTVFYAEAVSLVRFDAGLVEGRHRIRFQIAQGELKDVRVRVPEPMTVTAVEGEALGTWRFDPARHALEARLTQPITGEYWLTVVTQISLSQLPYTVSFAGLAVEEAVHQRGSLGLVAGPAVTIGVQEHPPTMNVDDFTREAAALLSGGGGPQAADVRHAYRLQKPEDRVRVEGVEVRPEIRATENAGFTVSDDRLVYNGQLAVEIAKAGVFSLDLRIPEGYDIDTLAAPEVSHWDDAKAGGARAVQVHFRQKLMGQTTLQLALSRAVSELPQSLAAPRIEVAGALKHAGQVVISSALGVRLAVQKRNGVSEQNPVELGIPQATLAKHGTMLAFKLLRPDWELGLTTEVVEPWVEVEFLHVARVTEGLVRHTHYLRYRLSNAGSKVFEVEAPKGALGLLITGSDIARKEEAPAGSGRWRVELANKVFDRPYQLTLQYETRFDRAAGEVKLATARALGTNLQRGHAVVYATDRVELAPLVVGASLQLAEARSVPRDFGSGDLSDAAFCYAGTTPEVELSFRATRHEAAALLEAEVLEAALMTVVTERGDSLHRAFLRLQVGTKRHLEARLPAGAQVWSVLVNKGAAAPSKRIGSDGREVTLIPLAQAASGELPVDVDLFYVVSAPSGWRPGAQAYEGPQFDLPLKRVTWTFFVPEGFDYAGFGGTLTVNEALVRQVYYQRYDTEAYDQAVRQTNEEDRKKAVALQSQGNQLAQEGRQYAAKQALEWAGNYSQSDSSLNEDNRVQLHRLIRQQAVVGLVGCRGRLRLQTGEAPAGAPAPDLGDRFNQADAERLQNSLSKPDSENLETIAERMIERQEAAAGANAQLEIHLPQRGRVLRFERSLQVKPNSDMTVAFAAEPASPARARHGWLWAAGWCAAIFILGWTWPRLAGGWGALRRRCAQPPPKPAAEEAAKPAAEDAKGTEPDAGKAPPDDEDDDEEEEEEDGG